MYDLLIKNATLADGTGAPLREGSVAVSDGKLVMNPAADAEAKEIIDAKGLVLSPGFIDNHCHEESTLGNPASTLSKLSQGITTVCAGQCGSSVYPVPTDPELKKLFTTMKAGYLNASDCGFRDVFDTFTTFAGYRAYAEKRPVAYNMITMTGHCSLRVCAMGVENRRPTGKELQLMKDLLRESMEHGSRGLSAGLIYVPSSFSEKEEIIELCKVVAEYDGTYAVHLRSEAATFVECVEEAIDIARRTGVHLNLSHHKVCGKDNWGKSEITLKMIRDARAEGIDVYTDVYPYLATGTSLNICLPKEFFSNGPDKMKQLLHDPSVRADLKQKIEKNAEGRWYHCGGFSGILVCGAPRTPAAENKTVAEYAAEIGRDEWETYFDLCMENGGLAQAACFAMCDEDLERILLDDNSVICTDSYDILPDNVIHPRCFGAFTRALGVYVREKKLMPLEKMVRKMTGATADFVRLEGKGKLLEGYDADLVLFDPETVAAMSDFRDSRKLSAGIERVIVAGRTVYQNGKLTGETPGRFISWKNR